VSAPASLDLKYTTAAVLCCAAVVVLNYAHALLVPGVWVLHAHDYNAPRSGCCAVAWQSRHVLPLLLTWTAAAAAASRVLDHGLQARCSRARSILKQALMCARILVLLHHHL
jgi:hypothetical protein